MSILWRRALVGRGLGDEEREEGEEGERAVRRFLDRSRTGNVLSVDILFLAVLWRMG